MPEAGRWEKLHELLHRALTLAGREPALLLPFDWVKDHVRIKGRRYLGPQTVDVDKIVGSLNRFRDFDRAFLPRRADAQRLARLEAAWQRGEAFPSVKLYKIGEAYFVEDGHHRVAAARRQGARQIDADVVEFIPDVPIEADISERKLLLKAEYSDFLRRTRLDELRPGQQVELSEPGGYRRLLEHIAVHRYFLGLEQGREVSYPEAVASWYDQVYKPLAQAIRSTGVLDQFPRRTVADLYVWISEHLYYLRERYGAGVDLEGAVRDYADRFGLPWLLRVLRPR
ncbi:MAG: DUF4032 domain-containing protein [Candidatus Bipolaricaulaceae bacterium]